MWEARIEVTGEQAEQIEQFLVETAAEGWHIFFEVNAATGMLTGYFDDEDAVRAAWSDMISNLPAELDMGEPLFREADDRDWREAYKEHFNKWHFEGLHWAPVWEMGEFNAPEGEEVVWLDPGMAFGTGNHETTRLCVERIVEARRELEGSGIDLGELEVLDAGCGSGILAISAFKCGFGKVAGFDLDPVAVEVSRENAAINDLAERVRFYEADLISGLQGRRVDLLIANIQADVLCSYASDLVAALKPTGRLVLSGILASELSHVKTCFSELIPEAAFSSRKLGEWADLQAVQSAHAS